MKTKTILATLLLVTASETYAACTQQNLTGLWHDYALGYNAGVVGWCKFIINKDSSVSGQSVCYNYTADTDLQPVYFTAGSFKIDKNCQITGTVYGDNGVISNFKGQMDKSKNSITGISRNNGGNIALQNFVKQ